MSNNQGVWCSKCYGDHYTNDCPEPVASVEAKEKERCEFCQLFAPLHSSTCSHWDTEPKPTPSTPDEPHKNGWHYGYITCSCGWAWDSRNTLTGSLATQHGLRIFEKHKAEVSKPQPDSSSIPEQTFEQWWNSHGRLFLAGDDVHVQRCVMNISERAWVAAKGKSNGR